MQCPFRQQVIILRIILFLTLGFASACALGAYVLNSIAMILCGIVASVFALVFLLIRKTWARRIFLCLLGCAMGFFWVLRYDRTYLLPIRDLDGETVRASVTITDYSNENYYGISADGRIEMEGKSYKIRIYTGDMQELKPGDRVAGKIDLKATTAGGAAESDYQQGVGQFLVGYVHDGAEHVPADRLELRYYPVALRYRILKLLDASFPESTLGFARALLLGDTRLLTYEEDSAFKVSGIRHVVAVSGLHVSILFSLLYMMAGKRRLWTAVLGIPLLILFMAVAGFTPSVVRACAMQILMILALLVNREYDPPTALAGAVLAMLILNPMSVLSVSLQLSVGCMAGIFLFTGKMQTWALEKLGEKARGKSRRTALIRGCVSSISVTLGAMTVTTPLCAYYFGMVSLIGILTNLLCLWMVTTCFYGIMISCLAGALWLPAGKMIAFVVSVPIWVVKGISKLLSGVPFGAVYTCSPYIVIWLLLSYSLLALFLLAKRKQPLLLSLSLVVSLFVAISVSCLEPVLGHYLVTVMDVGQGQCVLLRCGGENYLVDCGGEHPEQTADKAASLLLSQGIMKLDGIIVTHFDADHANGVSLLMSRIPTTALYLPDAPDSGDFREALTDAWEDRIIWISEDTEFEGKDWSITVYAGEPGKEDNESSLCVLFQRKNCDILITADRSIQSEDALLDTHNIPVLELLVVGHHGSESSTGLRLLKETSPAYAAISVGTDNRYGHPSEQVLARLEMAGCQVLRTDRDGDINFRR